MRNFVLRNICDCTIEQQLRVLEIRNNDAVRTSMYTEHMISPDEHLAYIERLRADDRQQVLIVLRDGDTAAGVVSVNEIDMLHKKCDWAFYLDESARGGVGSALELFMLDYVFETLNLDKLNCEVIETNPNVVAMHKKFGFVEEGLRRANIEKNGKRIGVYFLGITKSEWLGSRDRVREAMAAKVSDINIKLSDQTKSES